MWSEVGKQGGIPRDKNSPIGESRAEPAIEQRLGAGVLTSTDSRNEREEKAMVDGGVVNPIQAQGTEESRAAGQLYVQLTDAALRGPGQTAGVASAPLAHVPVWGQSEAGVAESTTTSTGIEDLDQALQSLSVTGVFRLAAGAGQSGVATTTPAETGLESLLVVEFDPSLNLDEAMSTLRQAGSVAEVSPVGIFTIAFTPDDPQFGNQWGLPDLHIPEMWDTTTGNNTVVVAVVDTGCDLNHADLTSQRQTGASFVPGVSTPQDDHGHGTHVCGTISAITNNAQDAAGIAPDVTLLPVKVLNSQGGAVGPSIAQGIAFAGARAHIMNCSIQGSTDDLAVRTAVANAVATNTVVVAAMGNHGWTETTPSYPAAYPSVVAVGAVDTAHNRSIWTGGESSNQGPWISVAAPGTDIVSLGLGGGVATKSGTSMASPHVAGVFALLLSAKVDATPSDMFNAIATTAEPLRDNASDPVPNNAYGYGLVNAKAALDQLVPPVGDFPVPGEPGVPDDGTRVASNEQPADTLSSI
jgi:subtilisin family serine protease